MTVKQIWTQNKVFKAENLGEFKNSEIITQSTCYNSTVIVEKNEIKGNCTEVGIVNFISKVN